MKYGLIDSGLFVVASMKDVHIIWLLSLLWTFFREPTNLDFQRANKYLKLGNTIQL